ncbi:mitochondrial peptide methionine sulfoxide reductase isoform X1 [Poecilia latipinna]|uniref:mitochondrial peptide methionine sulfoxide reductase isoform X1 n=1 Tax=Poecilia mexicana TaxID=48701 RepID=UPI00072DA1E1|nr:PREDICTED: mitochondrial peptide methionine sulfoxide reductase isoform X1 [Poecilia mexicana]XP_014890847.1 PREDICTED: mitochondrial peptide methionine sulfoxide reductase isoform X1 [Poecilia latipinna]XP_016520391.1 PREDICTED: mitochondrial peptide methionine sulfoxide reductase isoform X1 [Poecilia formosa]
MVSSSRLRLVWRHFINSRMGDMASKTQMPTPETALPGRADSIKVSAKHDVNGNRTIPPFPEGTQMVMFGMGCFWGAERKFWRQKGVYSTQVGYSGGYTPNATYEEVCTGRTGHTEVVRVVYHPEKISFNSLLKVFWESHDPTQGMRQGNDVGTTYRSAIYAYTQQQLEEALASKDQYQKGQWEEEDKIRGRADGLQLEFYLKAKLRCCRAGSQKETNTQSEMGLAERFTETKEMIQCNSEEKTTKRAK